MNILDLQSDPAAFRSALLIDTDGGPQPLRDCLDDWQAKDFAALDSGWRRSVVGCKIKATFQRGWLERARGHSKSGDLAVMASWALFASRRPLSGIAAAGDQDQARLLRDAIGRLCHFNPWLGSILTVQNYRVVNEHTGSTLDIISSDAPTSYGLLCDFVIADEVVHWKKRDLWDSLISSAAKRATCMFVVITNAGLQDDWCWQVREAVRTDPTWYFSRLDGSVASWITPDRLAEQERLLPSIAYRRLWLNEWSTGGGDALTPEVIDAAFIASLQPMTGNETGWHFIAGVDLGLTRDCAAVVVLAVPQGGRAGKIRLAHNRLWRPTRGKKINLLEIEKHILDLDQQYGLEFVAYDPWQMEHLAQTLEVDTNHKRRNDRRFFDQPWMRECPPTTANLREQATLIIESFNDRRLQLYDCEPLRRDLYKLRVEEKTYGVRLTSPRDGEGHGDTFSSFALALTITQELAVKRTAVLAPIFGAGASSSGNYISAFQERVNEYAREQQIIAQASDPDPIRQLMKQVGRLPYDESDVFAAQRDLTETLFRNLSH